jgi:glycosyltransferase involved in cell wall biosynthesis
VTRAGPPSPAAVTFVVGTTAGGTGEHVRMLAAGLARRGTAVTVAGPSPADDRFGYAALSGVTFVPVEFAGRPRAGDLTAIARLRRTLAPAGERAPRPDVRPVTGAASLVHAHGLRAGAFTVLALAGRRGTGRVPVVVTAHNAPPAGRADALIYRLLERIVARRADLVLCVSPDLERRMRAAGARRVRRAVVAAPDPRSHEPVPAALHPPSDGQAAPSHQAGPSRQPAPSRGAAPPGDLPVGRPLVLAVGRLAPQKGFATLLEAAASWQGLRPPPLLAIAGDGPLAAGLRARAAPLGDAVRFLGQRDDVPALLAAARVFVLPSLWEGQPLVLQQALRAGAAIVATRVGGIPAMTGDGSALRGDGTGEGAGGDAGEGVGEGAALLVAPGDAEALAAAVRDVLRDPALAARLRAAARRRATTLPAENDAIEAALAAYASAATR